MAFKRYKHLNVPESWERYWTKYPQGMTILESLFEWVSQVDSMVDNQNKLNDNVAQFRNEIDAFVERFDDRLQFEVTDTLSDWQESGFLDVVISEALQWQLTDYIATNEADKLSLNAQVQQIAISVHDFGAVGDGVTDDTVAYQNALDYMAENHLTLTNNQELTYIVKGLSLTDKSNFTIDFKGTLKTPDNVDEKTNVLFLSGCHNFNILNYNANGNATQNGVSATTPVGEYGLNEQHHLLNLFNCYDVTIGVVNGYNPLGDVLCIHGNATSANIQVNVVNGHATEAIGRQTVSIVSGKKISFNVINNYGVGHFTMPGGFDIEPYSTETIVEDIYVGNLYVKTGGFSGLGIVSLQNTLKNVYIENATVISTNVLGSYTREVIILGCKDVTINKLYIKTSHPTNSYGLSIGEVPNTPQPQVENVLITHLTVEGSRYGLIADNLKNVQIISATFKNIKQYFANLYNVEDFYINLKGNITTLGGLNSGGILLQTGKTHKNVTITGDLSKARVGDVTTSVFMTNGTPLLDNFVVRDLNLKGWAINKILVFVLKDITKINCEGLTTIETETFPEATYYKYGDFVRVLNPSQEQRIVGYLRIPNGFAPLSTITSTT